MTAKFGYVTTACRLCKDIVPPDGGDLRRGAIDGPVGPPVQPVLAPIRQRVAGRHGHGALRWKQPAESHYEHARLQPGAAHPLARAGHVPLLQPVQAGRQATDASPSGETAQLPVQRGVCGRLQQIPPGEERGPLHRVQPARAAAAPRPQPPARAAPQVLLLHEGGARLRHQQAQRRARRRAAQVASAAPAAAAAAAVARPAPPARAPAAAAAVRALGPPAAPAATAAAALRRLARRRPLSLDL